MGKMRQCGYCGKAVEWVVEVVEGGRSRSYPGERVRQLDVVQQFPNGDWEVHPGDTVLVSHLPLCSAAPSRMLLRKQ